MNNLAFSKGLVLSTGLFRMNFKYHRSIEVHNYYYLLLSTGNYERYRLFPYRFSNAVLIGLIFWPHYSSVASVVIVNSLIDIAKTNVTSLIATSKSGRTNPPPGPSGVATERQGGNRPRAARGAELMTNKIFLPRSFKRMVNVICNLIKRNSWEPIFACQLLSKVVD